MFRGKACKNRIARRIIHTLSDAVCSTTQHISVRLCTLQGILTAFGSILNFYNQIFLLAFSHAQFIAAIKIGNSNFFINGFYLPVIDVNSALFDEAFGFGDGLGQTGFSAGGA